MHPAGAAGAVNRTSGGQRSNCQWYLCLTRRGSNWYLCLTRRTIAPGMAPSARRFCVFERPSRDVRRSVWASHGHRRRHHTRRGVPVQPLQGQAQPARLRQGGVGGAAVSAHLPLVQWRLAILSLYRHIQALCPPSRASNQHANRSSRFALRYFLLAQHIVTAAHAMLSRRKEGTTSGCR